MSEELEDSFYVDFYDFCKQVFNKCCDIEEELFFPKFNTKELKKKIKNEDIQHQKSKSAFIEKIDKTLFFTKFEFSILETGADCESSIKKKININQFMNKIKQHLIHIFAFVNYVRNKTKDEKDELLEEFKCELYVHQFKRTYDNFKGDEIPKKGFGTGIELPKFSFSADQNITETRRYDAMEFLRELLQFKETKYYKRFFSNYIDRLYNNYNARESENLKEIKWRQGLKKKLGDEINILPLKLDDKEICFRFLSDNETYLIENFLKERQTFTPEIRGIISKLRLGRTINLDEPFINKDGEEKGSLIDNMEDDRMYSPEMEVIEQEEQREREEKIRQAPDELARIQRLVERFLRYVAVNSPKDKTLDKDIIIQIRKKIIFSFFCAREKNFIDTTTEIKLRRQIYDELHKIYSATNLRELDYALDIESHHNILWEILDSFRTKINQRQCQQENDRNEIQELSNYLTNILNELQR